MLASLWSVLHPHGVRRLCCVHIGYRTRGSSAFQLSPVVKRTSEVRITCECQHLEYERTDVSQTDGLKDKRSRNGRSVFVFSIYRLMSRQEFHFPMAQPGGMKLLSIHSPALSIQNYTLPPPFIKNLSISKLNPPGAKIKFCLLQKIYYFCK